MAGVTTTEILEVKQKVLFVRGGELVTVKGPHVALEDVVRQERPCPVGSCGRESVHCPTFHFVLPV